MIFLFISVLNSNTLAMAEPKKIFEAEAHGLRSTKVRQGILWSHATLESKRWCAQQSAINVVIQMAAHIATSGGKNASLLFQNPPFTKSVYSGKYTTDIPNPSLLFLSRDSVGNSNNFSEAKVTWLDNPLKLYSLNPSWSRARQMRALSLMESDDSIGGFEKAVLGVDESSVNSQNDASAKDTCTSSTSGKDSINTVKEGGMTFHDSVHVMHSTPITSGEEDYSKRAEGEPSQGSQENQQALPKKDTKMTDICKKRKFDEDSNETQPQKRQRSISYHNSMVGTEVIVFRPEDCFITQRERAWMDKEERELRLKEARRREAEVKKEVEKARYLEMEARKGKCETYHQIEPETKKRKLETYNQMQFESWRKERQTFYQRESELNRSTARFYQRESESNRSTEIFYQRQSESGRRECKTFYHPAMYYRRQSY